MLTDAGALALALVASKLAQRPAKGKLTFGLGRAEVLSAQVNGVTLLVLAGLIVAEAIRRLIDPPDVLGGWVLATAIVGIGVNLLATRVLAGARDEGMHVEGAYQHVLTDLYAFLATALAGAIVLLTGFETADPLASLVVAGLMLLSGWGLLRDSGRVLIEAAPEGIDPDAVGRAMAARPGVLEVHDLHVWEVNPGFPAVSAHVIVSPGADCHALRRELSTLLRTEYGLDHSTLQVEHAVRDELVSIESTP
jgi:cobalt-zinc-cadmium efflux system protein